MKTDSDNLDLFCRFYVQTDMPHKEFVLWIARCIGGTSSMNSARNQSLDVSVDDNDAFDAEKSLSGKDRWLYFRCTLELDPVDGVSTRDYVVAIRALLTSLWSSSLDAVASCDFEEQLPRNERLSKWAAA